MQQHAAPYPMSTTPFTADATQPVTTDTQPSPHPVAELLICLPALAPDALPSALQAIVSAFPSEYILVACPTSADASDIPTHFPSLELIPYTSTRSEVGWVLAAGDYASAAHLALERSAGSIILLGGDPAALSAPNALNPTLLRSLADALRSQSTDLVLPRFTLGPNDALVNSALLYPLSRALFGADIHFPLPIDAAISARMAQRLAITTQRLIALNQGSTLLWPVAEAAAAGFSVREVSSDATPPTPPVPQTQADFNALFASVAGSLFADIEAKATFWQRARALTMPPARLSSPPPSETIEAIAASPEIHSMIETFRIAQDNLQEIWALVLPPQSRLALKKLSQLSPDAFTMEPDLWARVVYDFALAFHLRTLNRSHLLGAMTPLYLAWVASHLRFVADDPTRAAHAIEITASAFESEKSYIVSRWRWPDRFNP
jgi:glucosylglycerate synthase